MALPRAALSFGNKKDNGSPREKREAMDTSVEVKILLVDDTPANLVALEAVLDPLQYDIVKAHSGSEAIGILESTDIGLVILDVQMPQLDGFETAKLIKERMPDRNIPIIFMTAIYTEDPYVQKGYAVGGVDYFGKPFDPAVLKAKVRLHAEMYRQSKLLQRMEERLKELERRNGSSRTGPEGNGSPYILHINAAPQKVWQGLTQPEFTKKYWVGQCLETDWKVGSALRQRMPDGGTAVKGRVLVADRPKTLSYSWEVDGKDEPASGIPATITFSITPFRSTTALTMVHKGLSADAEVHAMVNDVWQVALCGLKTLVETGKPLPFQWKEFFEGKGPGMNRVRTVRGRRPSTDQARS